MNLASLDDVQLGIVLRGGRGPLCPLQVRVMRQLLHDCNAAREIQAPNMTALAREIGVARPTVSHAIAALRRKGVLEMRKQTKSVVSEKTERVLRIVFDPEQFMLPFGTAA